MKVKVKIMKFGLVNMLYIFVILIPLLVNLVEIFTYRGFISNHFLLSTTQVVYFVIFIITIIFFIKAIKIDKYFSMLSKLLTLTLILSIVAYILFGYLEEINYPNFVFTKFHVDFQNLPALISYNFYIVLLLLVKQEIGTRILPIKDRLFKYVSFLTAFLLSIYLINNATSVLALTQRNLSYVFANPGATYDQKMTKKLGFFYDYLMFVKGNTPEDAIIHIPPQLEPWLSTGNVGLVRYFLYPRTLINTNDPFKLADTHFDYALISKGFYPNAGNWGHGWPKVPIEAEKIWYIDPETKAIEEYEGNYDPKESEEWGLIKVK